MEKNWVQPWSQKYERGTCVTSYVTGVWRTVCALSCEQPPQIIIGPFSFGRGGPPSRGMPVLSNCQNLDLTLIPFPFAEIVWNLLDAEQPSEIIILHPACNLSEYCVLLCLWMEAPAYPVLRLLGLPFLRLTSRELYSSFKACPLYSVSEGNLDHAFSSTAQV